MKNVYLLLFMFVFFQALEVKAQPSYCTPNSYCYYGDFISNVSFANIYRTSSCDNNYGSYSFFYNTVANVYQLSNYAFSVTGGYWDNVYAWIDYNQDGFFDNNSELVLNGYSGGLPYSVGVTIPITALTGNTRIRVAARQNGYPDPCSSYYYGETEDYLVNINPAPLCSGTPGGGNATTNISYSCGPFSNVVLDLSGITNSGLTFQWQSSTDNSFWNDILGATSMHSVSADNYYSTTYYRCVTTCTSSGSTATSNVLQVTVPTTTYHPSITVTGPLTKCEGDTSSVILTANGPGPFMWSTGETTTSINVSYYTSPGFYGFWVNNTDSTTCFPDSSSIKSLVVNAVPYIIRYDTNTLCLGEHTTIFAYGYFPDSVGFLWNTGATSQNLMVNTGGKYTVSYKGCPSLDTIAVKSTNSTYRPTITIMGNDTICEGTTVVLKANKNKHYLWNTGATTQSIIASGYIYGNTYNVVNPDSNYCVSTSNSVTITWKGAPVINYNGTNYICPGTAIGLYAYSPWWYTGTHFVWTNGAVGQSTNINTAGSYNVSMDGCYALQPAVFINACYQPYGVSGAPYSVVNHKVTMRISWYGACGIGFQMQYRKVGTTNWTTVNINSITNFFDINSLKQGTYYECQVRSKCQNSPTTYSPYSSIIVFYVPVARLGEITEPEEEVSYDTNELGLSLYPNPTDQNINISFHAEDQKAQMRIFNINGQLVEEKTIESIEGNFSTIEDVSGFTSGIYFVMIITDSQKLSGRFIKE